MIHMQDTLSIKNTDRRYQIQDITYTDTKYITICPDVLQNVCVKYLIIIISRRRLLLDIGLLHIMPRLSIARRLNLSPHWPHALITNFSLEALRYVWQEDLSGFQNVPVVSYYRVPSVRFFDVFAFWPSSLDTSESLSLRRVLISSENKRNL